MAKTTTGANKVIFGSRKGGKSKKSSGPKDKKVSKYVGQGK